VLLAPRHSAFHFVFQPGAARDRADSCAVSSEPDLKEDSVLSLEYTHESLEEYPRKFTTTRTWSNFEKPWSEVQLILERELRMLGYRHGSVKIKTAHRSQEVLRSGKLRSDVRNPEHPGVVVAFDVYDGQEKRYVPMSFECDKFLNWRDNVRAIADAMEALRKVNRYGVTGGGRSQAQYEGYKALPTAEGKIATVDAALEFVSKHSSIAVSELRLSATARYSAYKKAAKVLHPDAPGGNVNDFINLEDAKRILSQL
jgi:hypothetical protein